MWSLQGTTDLFDVGIVKSTVSAMYGQAQFDYDLYNRIAPGWTFGGVPALRAQGVLISPFTGQSCAWQFALTKLTLIMPDKGEIQLRDDAFDGEPQPAVTDGGCAARDANRGTHWHATDGSGIVFISDSGSQGVSYGDLSGTAITADGLRYHFANVTYPGGIQSDNNIHNLARCDQVTDRNGNFIQISYSAPPSPFKEVDFTDQLGRVTTLRKNANDPANPSGPRIPLLITLPGYNGQPRYIKVLQAQVNQLYRSDQFTTSPVWSGDYSPGLNNYTQPAGSIILFPRSDGVLDDEIDNKTVVSQIVLPDGRTLGFKYNQFGEIAEIDTPFGGSIQYDYTNSPLLPSGNTPLQERQAQMNTVTGLDRAVAAKRTYVGGVQEGNWTYTYAPQTPTNVTTQSPCTEVVCTDIKNGNNLLLHQRHFFNQGFTYFTGQSLNGKDGTNYSVWFSSLEFRAETFDTNGSTVLQASETDWTQRAAVQWSGNYTNAVQEPTPPGEQPENDNRTTEARHFLDDGSMAKVDTQYDDAGASPRANNPTSIDEYDFGGTQKRHTAIVYVQGYAGITTHLLRLVQTRSVYDVTAGTLFAQTTLEYDNYTPEQGTQNPAHQPLDDHGGVTISGHNVTYDKNWLARGNPTAITQFGGLSPTTNSYPRYDILGSVVSIMDPNGNVTTASFVDDFGAGSNPGGGTLGTFGATFAFPTLLTSPPPQTGQPQQTARSQYDFSTGLLTGFKDRNATITQTIYNDPFDRPTLTKAGLAAPGSPATGVETHTAFYYAPTTIFGVTLGNADVLTAKDQAILDDGNLRSWTHTDGFGRVVENWTHDTDTRGDIKMATTYDALSRRVTTSNPFRPPTDTEADSVTVFDMAGRVKSVTMPDNAMVFSYYSGNRALVKDQAGKERLSATDALGRLTDVWEITSTDTGTYPSTDAASFPGHTEVSAGYHTSYGYDPLDDLKSVTQGGQTPRTFTYDGLKRLLSASNPESGVIAYQYDSNGNLTQKTDPRASGSSHVLISYSYDALNRLLSRTYTIPSGITPQVGATPTVTYTYDRTAQGGTVANGIGRLTSVSSSVSGYTYDTFDALGRVTQSTQTTNSTAYQFNYTYDLAGEMGTEKYPSGTTVSTTYDQTGRVNGVTQTTPVSKTYASTFSYAPQGAVSSMTLGTGLIEKTTFNNRLQPTEIQLGTSTVSGIKLDLVFTYNTSGNNDNNGNVLTQTITAAGSTIASQTYTYDALNRLATATEASAWGQTSNYDRFGNRWVTNPTGINLNPLTPTAQTDYNGANNQIAASTYDLAGNQYIDKQGNGYFYDAENHQTSCNVTIGGVASTSTYSYDGDGHRVTKTTSAGTILFVYDIGGRLIAEYGGQASSSNSGTSYLTTDHLGSTRLVTKSDQSVIARHDYLPFGEEIFVGTGRTTALGYNSFDDTRQKFTSKERDSESGLDYFQARYYASAQGRFTSTDPVIVTPERFRDPQQFNQYAYTRNNPLRFVDPTGKILTLSGDVDEARKQLALILGTADADKRIMYDAKTNTITVDLTGIDLSQNEGAVLLNDLVTSKNRYDLAIGSDAETLGGTISLDPKDKKNRSSRDMVNLDNNPDDRFNILRPPGKTDKDKPKAGIDDQVAFNLAGRSMRESSTSLKPAIIESIIFHELAEAYAKVEHNKQYASAHQEAIDRETKLREQRPYLKAYNPGSGPGDNVIIKK